MEYPDDYACEGQISISEWLESIERKGDEMNVGDMIRCHDEKEMISIMECLAKEGITTGFVYEKDGEKGLWLEITKVEGKDV